MKGIISYTSASLSIKGSRFLAESFPVSTQEEARELLKRQKGTYADARHVVHAFVIGPTGGILGCSDDGEPSGTAGRPVLDVLKGSGITGIMLTVTRWFGGTLLGTGGLVKAYGDAAKAVLEVTSAAELVEVRDFTLAVSYELHDKVLRELPALGAAVLREDFDVRVTIRGSIADEKAAYFEERIYSLSSGQCRVELSSESRTIPVA